MAEPVVVEPIQARESKELITLAIGSIVILIPMINMAFGLHILLPTEPQQAAMVNLIEIAISLIAMLYAAYRRMYVTTSPIRAKAPTVNEFCGDQLTKTPSTP